MKVVLRSTVPLKIKREKYPSVFLSLFHSLAASQRFHCPCLQHLETIRVNNRVLGTGTPASAPVGPLENMRTQTIGHHVVNYFKLTNLCAFLFSVFLGTT